MSRVYTREPPHIRLEKRIDRIPIAGCWIWTGAADRQGYGRINVNGKIKLTHRVAYEFYVGKIPTGLELDHLCRNPTCVNPSHLEPVTRKVNTDRGLCAETHRKRFALITHCKRGHPLFGSNLYVAPKHKYRTCRTCVKMRQTNKSLEKKIVKRSQSM